MMDLIIVVLVLSSCEVFGSQKIRRGLLLGTKTKKPIPRPSLSAKPSETVRVGTGVVLTCKGKSELALTFEWYRDNTLLPKETKETYTLTGVQSSSSDRYHCKRCHFSSGIFDFVCSESKPLVLTVLDNPTVSANRKTRYRIGDDVLAVGDDVTLTCSFDSRGIRITKFEWYRDNQLQQSKTTKTLVLLGVHPPSSSQYHCKVLADSKIFVSKKLTLTVIAHPSLWVSPSKTVRGGTDVVLTCSFNDQGLGCQTYNWYRNDQLFYSGPYTNIRSTFELKKIQSSSSGRYYCDVRCFSWGLSSMIHKIYVPDPPKPSSIHLSSTPYGPIFACSKVNVTLTCQGGPGIEYTFYHYTKNVSSGPHNTMELQSAKFTDSGNYTCKTKFKDGSSMKSNILNLFVYDRPNFTTDPPEGAITSGSNIVMTCSLPDKKPPNMTYTFFHDNNVIQQSASNKYELRQAFFDLSGDYLCTARLKDCRSLESEKRTIIVTGTSCPMNMPNNDYNRRLLNSITPREETTRWGKHKTDEKDVHDDL